MAIPYELAAKITLQDEISSKLAVITKSLGILDGSVAKVSGELAKMGRVAEIAVGGLMMFGSQKVIGGLVDLAKASNDLLDAQVKLKNVGVGYNEVLRVQSDYFNRIAKVAPTSTASEALNVFRDLRGVVGADVAQKYLAEALQTNALLKFQLGDKAGSDPFYTMLRSAEIKGVSMSPELRDKLLNREYSYMGAFGGKLLPQDFTAMAKYGGTAYIGANISDQAFGALAIAAADMGGARVGTSLQSMYQVQTGAHTLTKQQIKMWSDLGLIDWSKVAQTGFGGSRYQLLPGAVRHGLEYAGNVPGFDQDIVKPLIDKYIAEHPLPGVTKDQYEQSIFAKLYPNRTAAQLATMLVNPGFTEQRGKDIGLSHDVLSRAQAYKNFVENSPSGVQQAFFDQLHSMEQALGGPLMQAALPSMRAMTDFFSSVGAAANSHPRIFADLFKSLGSLTSAAFLGGLGTLVAGPMGGLIGALAGAIGGLVILNWDSITSGIKKIGGAIKWLWDEITTLGGLLGGAKKTNFVGSSNDLLHYASYYSNDNYGSSGFNPSDVRYANYESYAPSYLGAGGGGGGGSYSGGSSGGGDYGGGGAGTGVGGSVSGGGGHRGGGGWSGVGAAVTGPHAAMPSGGMAARAQALMSRLIHVHGWTPEAAAIAAGNAQQESSFNPNGRPGDGGISHGLFQWNHERFAALQRYAASVRKSWTDWSTQIDFMANEAARKVPGWSHVHSLASAGAISHAYEGFGDNSTGTRIANARRWLNFIHQHPGAVPPPARGHDVPLHASIHMDGRAVASVVTRAIAKNNRDVRGASHFDGRAMKTPVDMNYQLSI